MQTIREQLKNVQYNQEIHLPDGSIEYVQGAMVAQPLTQLSQGAAWSPVAGAEPTVFVWTDALHVYAILPQANDKPCVEMTFDIAEAPDGNDVTTLLGGAKEFAQKKDPVQPRWTVVRNIFGGNFSAADLAVIRGTPVSQSVGMMHGGLVVPKYVLYETRDGQHVLYLTVQNGVQMSGVIQNTVLINGRIVDFDDVIESIQ